MSLEARVKNIESKQDALEHAFRENNKIFEATHGVVSLILNEQRAMQKEQEGMKKELKGMKNEQQAMRNEISANQRETCKRFDKIEETLIQIVNHLAK
ncbi:hypothetical protein [Endozoicomonas elysicola]|uniref:Uncharacterized protein n=1 Tax=Endozoicomonas elysicola TaxID=305900 RepID=A0A081K9D9_9GAMM|nr:hypothetical protein [Endozoicomonas elysicola]KEI70765.1 hypothetical protein GV64_08420 [Endozoicomonas elysicola]